MSPPPPTGDPVQPLRELLPEDRLIGVRELLDELNLASKAPPDRPYTIANFVASADGHASFRGRSRDLSNPGDREMFHGLREHVDAILVGTVTLRIERYGRLIRDAERRHRRAASGLAPDPIACVFSRSGEIPTDIPLFDDPASRVVVFTPTRLDTSHLGAQIEVVHLDPGELTLTTMMRRLRAGYDVRSVLCEGGPTLFGALLQEDLIDELFLSLAAKLTGGGASPAISRGAELAELRDLNLVWALEQDSSLYLRYTVE